MSIYLTGDLHGNLNRLLEGGDPRLDGLTKEDYVIVCGDFGGVWDISRSERELLYALEKRPFTTLFVDGNHENFDFLNNFRAVSWHGGWVHAVRPTVLHLMRGQVFEIGGKRFFTMGGARSHDVYDGILEPGDPDFYERLFQLEQRHAAYRINHISWWEAELPSEEEYGEARRNLEKAGWSVDYIVTHAAPENLHRALVGGPGDALTGFLQTVAERCAFKGWFFGHYHQDQDLGDGFRLLYKDVVPLPEEEAGA